MSMTHMEGAVLTGRRGRLRTEGLEIEVLITDAREVYGRKDVFVTPRAGRGSKWVSLDRVTLMEE